jgi:hypothetical protein
MGLARERKQQPEKRDFVGILLQNGQLVYLSREYSPDCSNSRLSTMWTRYFNFIKLRHGRVIVPIHGEIDFSRDDIPLEICKELFDKSFPYLELFELGKKELFGTLEKTKGPKQESISNKKL